jgi:tetratricopeptide (TPR) repeat protein
MLFVDLETTGIAGGAGTYAFLVGCAWFDQGRFRVRQFFLTSFIAERALLQAVMDVARTAGTVVTYNGKTFDLPLVETRFTMHRMETPFATMPHIDMLHPARRLWRGRTADGSSAVDAPGRDSCRLSVMEQSLCGHIREGDVAGFEIPARYFQFVRTGDARPLEAVFEHNRLDLLSLALVTARAAQLLDEGAPATRSAREALGLGRLYERGGLTTDAWRCYARAIELDDEDVVTRADGLRAHAVLSRRMRRFEEAASLWRRLLEMPQCPAPMRREASEALAVHLEHRLRDYQSAKGYAMTSLDASTSVARKEATLHRVARLNRKLETRVRTTPLPL